ncbi:MAG: hypothetical protein JWM11_693 [Planctomycetaceae bacterium]|nr:hypothetical protein [Planctomycetaceae bacterium]
MIRSQLEGIAKLYPPASDDAIRAAEAELGFSLPAAYAELLRCSDGLEPYTEGCAICLFPADELAKMNRTYEVQDFLPSMLFIGLDGGGRGIFLPHAENPSPVYETGMGALFTDHLRKIAPDLQSWIDSGFDMQDPPEVEYPEKIDIYLAKVPAGGLKTLLRFRQELNLSIPIAELRSVLADVPFRLLQKVPYYPFSVKCKKLNVGDPCLEFHESE